MLTALPTFWKPRLFTYLLKYLLYLTQATFSFIKSGMHDSWSQREEVLIAWIPALIIDLNQKTFFKHLELKFP